MPMFGPKISNNLQSRIYVYCVLRFLLSYLIRAQSRMEIHSERSSRLLVADADVRHLEELGVMHALCHFVSNFGAKVAVSGYPPLRSMPASRHFPGVELLLAQAFVPLASNNHTGHSETTRHNNSRCTTIAQDQHCQNSLVIK
jgi:hypothetical protein